MSAIRQSLGPAIGAVRILGATDFSWFGRRCEPLPRHLRRALNGESAHSYLLFQLTSRLYRSFYCRGVAERQPEQEARVSDRSRTIEFGEELSNANQGLGYWEGGWRSIRTDKGAVIVSKRGFTLRVPPQQARINPRPEEPMEPAEDTGAAIYFPKESGVSPGFYMAMGDVPFGSDDSQSMVRLYWNVRAEGAANLVATSTRLLNRAGIPFKLKILNEPENFSRCDAAVLYVSKQTYKEVAAIGAELYSEMIAHMNPLTPAFTKSLAPGLGLAESLPGGDSFGLHRCNLVAEGLLQSHEQRAPTADAIIAIIDSHFAAAGFDLDLPYLNPGSGDSYEPIRITPRTPAHTMSRADLGPRSSLAAAEEIGWRLSKEAFWHSRRCNWLGSLAGRPQADGSAPTQQMLDTSFYSGTSGVALFLAELFRITGEVHFRKTALGGIEQALSRLDSEVGPTGLGLFSGWPGIALAATRIAMILGADGLFRKVKLLAKRRCDAEIAEAEYDIMSGLSGGITALLLLSELLRYPSLMDVADSFGRELIRRAEKDARGISWRSPAEPRNLTGFSHGTAGVAFALLELFAATGEAEFRRCAEGAFEYERFWFDNKTGNWPDLRTRSAGRRKEHYQTTAWCHGAPGIALSRVRAYELTGSSRLRDEAVISLQTTMRWIDACLANHSGDLSLCHGLTGNAEILSAGYRSIGSGCGFEQDTVHRVAGHCIECNQDRWGAQPYQAIRDVPGLMLGMAGVGHFYLRLLAERPPSVLLIQRQEWCANVA